jgi:site-specific recombinase XerD
MIGDKLGISGISTYTARHSYASILKRSGANIAYISSLKGSMSAQIKELPPFEQVARELGRHFRKLFK